MTNVQLQLIDIREISRLTGFAPRTLWRWQSAGKFPRPDVTVGKTKRWKPSTIQAWIERGGAEKGR